MKSVREYDFFDWYAVVVLCVGSGWRIAVAWSLREAVGLSVVSLVIGLLPYAAFAKLSRSVRSKVILVAGAILVIGEDVHVKMVLDHSRGSRDGVALFVYPLFVSFWVFFIDSIVTSVNKRSRK